MAAATAKAMGIEAVLTAPHAPWQNAFDERFIGSARRECLGHVIGVQQNDWLLGLDSKQQSSG